MRKSALIAAIPVLIVLLSGCGNSSGEKDAAQPAQVVTVRVAPVTRGDLDVALQAYGQTDVLNRVNFVSPIDGTVTSLNVEVGSSVKSGDTLAIIRTRDSEASIAGAQRMIDEAASDQQRSEAQKAMRIARESQQLVPIIAHGYGEVVQKDVSVGQTVTANTELLQMVDLSTLDFIANVPLQDIPQVKVGQRCKIRFPVLPNREFEGSVAAVSAQSEAGTQASLVRIALHIPTREIESALRIGMMGTAEIITGELKDVLVVPRAALLRDDITDTYTLYTVNRDSLAIAVPVQVGFIGDSLAQISTPLLDTGQTVIVEGNYEVSDSTRVTVKDEAK
jgi:RND family efflux transporter MFP subunit